MFKSLRKQRDPVIIAASAKAEGLVAKIGGLEPCEVSLRADELGRWVFAVFYRGPMPAMPTPYKLVAVSKDSNEASELEASEVDRYRPRDYK